MSYPNQLKITIQKEKVENDFLQVGNKEWHEAIKAFQKPATFAMYLYLSSNKDKYKFDLSCEAFCNATGYKKHAYRDAIKELEENGYIIRGEKNALVFHTTPKGEKKADVIITAPAFIEDFEF